MNTLVTVVFGVATLFAVVARAGHSPLDETFEIKLLGRNRRSQDQWDLPTGIPERLLGTTSVTVQFVPSDTGGCFSKQLTQILAASPTKFRAR